MCIFGLILDGPLIVILKYISSKLELKCSLVFFPFVKCTEELHAVSLGRVCIVQGEVQSESLLPAHTYTCAY